MFVSTTLIGGKTVVIEGQSLSPDALLANAVAAGYAKDSVTITEVADAAFLAAIAPADEDSAEVLAAKSELAQLDLYIPRSTEDLIDAGVIQETSLSTYNQTRLARKRELRSVINA